MEIIWGSNELADYDEYISETYNGATRIGDPTRTYNCHAYAWHVSEGWSERVWLSKETPDAHSIYWTDGSYIEVPENISTKVVYVGSHSAVRINSSTYRSKWGAGPIVEHGPNDVPIEYHNHNSSNPKRYFIANPLATSSIFGPDRTEPNTRQNYVAPLRPSVTFTGWTITPSSYTTTGGTNGNTLYITFTAPGQYTLTANYTLPGNTPYSITKTVAAAVTLPPLPPKPSIDGSGQSWVQVRTTYSVPEPPDTVTFTGWTISPADYTATGGLNNLELNVKFTATTQYTLQANFSMPDGRTYSSNTKTVTVDPLPALPTISGPAETAWNADVTYSYKPPWSTGPPPPLTFSNWSITPNDYRTPNGTTNHTLDIRFGAADQYIVKANFSLPDGSSLSSTKTVIVKKFSAPIIAYNYENGEPAGPALWTAKACVFNVQTQVDYEWSINGNLVYSSPTFPTSIYLPAFNSNDRFVVSCRARMGAAASNWSNTLTVTAP